MTLRSRKHGAPIYRDWIPDDLGASSPAGATSLAYQRPGERGEATIGQPYADDWIKHKLDYVGVDVQTLEDVITVGRTIVGRGSIDQARIAETMANTDYERDGAYAGFDLYRRRDTPQARGTTVAFGDDTMVFARGDPAAVEDVIDTGAGRRTRRQETTDAFARLTDDLGAMPVTTVSRGRSDGGDSSVLAGGTGIAFDDSYAYYVRTQLYESGAHISRRDLERRIEESPRALDATRVDIRIDDPIVTVVFQLDHGTFTDLYGPLYEYPLISWGFDYDGDTETVRLTHQAGDAVEASLFTLKHARTDEPTDEQFTDASDTIEAGDSLTVDVSRRDEWHVRLDGTVPGTDETWTEFNVGKAWFDE